MTESLPEPLTPARIAVPKKTRFEVFKRDKFSCQYCGAKAPDVLLHVDHVVPVADGGGNDLLNLVTACAGCNSGKGARRLDDRSEMTKQHAQLAELEERRAQIEMMVQWRDELSRLDDTAVEIICNRIGERTGWFPNDKGIADVRGWLRRMPFDDVIAGIDTSFDTYGVMDGPRMTEKSWNLAFRKVAGVIGIQQQAKDKPWLPRLFYIQGILRNRCRNRWMKCVDALEEMVTEGVPVHILDSLSRGANSWDEFAQAVDRYIADQRSC